MVTMRGFSVRLPEDLLDRIDRVARAQDRSRGYVIRCCCEQVLPKLEEQQARTRRGRSVVG